MYKLLCFNCSHAHSCLAVCRRAYRNGALNEKVKKCPCSVEGKYSVSKDIWLVNTTKILLLEVLIQWSGVQYNWIQLINRSFVISFLLWEPIISPLCVANIIGWLTVQLAARWWEEAESFETYLRKEAQFTCNRTKLEKKILFFPEVAAWEHSRTDDSSSLPISFSLVTVTTASPPQYFQTGFFFLNTCCWS